MVEVLVEESFVAYLRTEDRAYLEAVARENIAWVYGVCLSVTRDPVLAEEATQETFLRMVRSAGTYQAGHSFRGWLYRIAQNAARTQAVKRRDPTMDPRVLDERPGPTQEFRAVRETLETLPEEFRRPVELHYLLGFSYQEVGEALEIPEGTVASRLSTARERLKAALAGAGVILAWSDAEAALAALGRTAPSAVFVERVAALLRVDTPLATTAALTGSATSLGKMGASIALLAAAVGTGVWIMKETGGESAKISKDTSLPVANQKPHIPSSTLQQDVLSEKAKQTAPSASREAAEDENNAATHYRRAYAVFDRGKPSLRDRLAELHPALREDMATLSEAAPREFVVTHAVEIETFLQDGAEVFGHLETAFKMDVYKGSDPESDNPMTDLIAHIPSLYHLEELKGMSAAGRGSTDEAMDCFLTGWRMAGQIRQDDMLISYLVALALTRGTTANMETCLSEFPEDTTARQILAALRRDEPAGWKMPLENETTMARKQAGLLFEKTCREARELVGRARPDLLAEIEAQGMLDPGKAFQQWDREYSDIIRTFVEKVGVRDMAGMQEIDEWHRRLEKTWRDEATARPVQSDKFPWDFTIFPTGRALLSFLALKVEGALSGEEILAGLRRYEKGLPMAMLYAVTPALPPIAYGRAEALFERNALGIQAAASVYAKETGAWPQRMWDLVQYLPPEVFDDPFTPQRLQESWAEGALVLRSAGTSRDGKELVVRLGPLSEKGR